MHSHIDNNEDKKQNKNMTGITAIHLTDVPAAVVFWEPVDLVTLLHIFCYPPITLSLVLKKKTRAKKGELKKCTWTKRGDLKKKKDRPQG